ncbi:hypothetical protein LCGC14_2391780, partial [marine sediment metagenome]
MAMGDFSGARKDLIQQDAQRTLIIFERKYPDFKEKQREIIKEINTNKKIVKNTVLGWITKDGREVIMEHTIIPITDENGNIVYFESIGRDITERKRAEEELQRSKERFKALIESSNEGIVSAGSDGRIAFASAAAERMFGYGPGELDGQAIETLVPERSRDEHVGHRTDYASHPEPRPMGKGLTLAGRRKDGTEFPVEISLSPLEGPDGGQIMALISDITERERMEAELRQSTQRNVALIDAIPDMMFTIDRRGVYVDFVPANGNEPYAPPDQFLGRTVFEVLPASLAQDVMQGVELALDSGRPERLEYELELDDGRHQYEGRIVKSKDDEALAIVRDVTAQKRLEREEELRRVRDELEGRVEKEMLGKNPYGLTFREFTVLHLAANGAADKEIADQLGISTFTVSKHVANILGKMAASSRTEACVRALRAMVYVRLGADGRRGLAEDARWLVAGQLKTGGWGYGSGAAMTRLNPKWADGSNSYFALLALHEAERVGVNVQSRTWRLAKAHWENCQNLNGSWGYRD